MLRQSTRPPWQAAQAVAASASTTSDNNPQSGTEAFHGVGQEVGAAENDTAMQVGDLPTLGQELLAVGQNATSNRELRAQVVRAETLAAERLANAVTDDPGKADNGGESMILVEEDITALGDPVQREDLTNDEVKYEAVPKNYSGIDPTNMLSTTRARGGGDTRTDMVAGDTTNELLLAANKFAPVAVAVPTEKEGMVNVFLAQTQTSEMPTYAQMSHDRGQSWQGALLLSVCASELDLRHPRYRLRYVVETDAKPDPDNEGFKAWMHERAEEKCWKACQILFGPNAAETWPSMKENAIENQLADMEKDVPGLWDSFILETHELATREPYMIEEDSDDERDGDRAPEDERVATQQKDKLKRGIDEAKLDKYSALLERLRSQEAQHNESMVEDVFNACGGPSDIVAFSERLKWLSNFSDDLDDALIKQKLEAATYPVLVQIQACLRNDNSDERLTGTNAALGSLDESQRNHLDAFLKRHLPSDNLGTMDDHVIVTKLTEEEAAGLANKLYRVYDSIYEAESESGSEDTQISGLCSKIAVALWQKKFEEVTALLQNKDMKNLPDTQMQALKTALRLPETFTPCNKSAKTVLSSYENFLKGANDETLGNIKTDVLDVPCIVCQEEDKTEGVHTVKENAHVVQAIPILVEAFNACMRSTPLQMPGPSSPNPILDMKCQINMLGKEVVDVVSQTICETFKNDQALMVAVWKALIETELCTHDLLIHQSGGVITNLWCVLEVRPHGVLVYSFPSCVVKMLQNDPSVPAITTLSLSDVVEMMRRGQIFLMSHRDCLNMQRLALRDLPVAVTVLPYAGQNVPDWWVKAEQILQTAICGPQGSARPLEYCNVFTVIEGTPVVHASADELATKVVDLEEMPTVQDNRLLVTAADGEFFHDHETGNCLVIQFKEDVWHVTVQKTADGTPTLQIANKPLQYFRLPGLSTDFSTNHPYAEMISPLDGEGKFLIHQVAYKLVLDNCKIVAEDWNISLEVVLSMVAIKFNGGYYKLTPKPYLLPAGTTGPVHGLTESGESTAKNAVRRNLGEFSEAVVDGMLGGAEMSRVLKELLDALNQCPKQKPKSGSKKQKLSDVPLALKLALASHDVTLLKQEDYDWLKALWAEDASGKFNFETNKFSSDITDAEGIVQALTKRFENYHTDNKLDLQKIVSYLTETGILMVETLVESKLVETRTKAVQFMNAFSICHEAEKVHEMIGNTNGLRRFHIPGAVWLNCLPKPLNGKELQALQGELDIVGHKLIPGSTTQANFFLPIFQRVLPILSEAYQADNYTCSEHAAGMWPVTGDNVIGVGSTERHVRDNEERDEEWKLSGVSVFGEAAELAYTDDRVYAALKELADKKTEVRTLVKNKVKGPTLEAAEKKVADATLALLKWNTIEPQDHVTPKTLKMTEENAEKFEFERRRHCDELQEICEEAADSGDASDRDPDEMETDSDDDK